VSLVGWVTQRFGRSAVRQTSYPRALAGYLALSRLPGFGPTLDGRTVLLAERLAAILSGCRWCVDRTGHDWRVAGLPGDLLDQLNTYSNCALFTDRERAALSFIEVVARSPASMDVDLDRVRAFLSESELAELTAIVAEHHCFEGVDSNLPDA
jgi:alkylhydroperoxidase family enzyme